MESLKATIVARIEALAASEKITKAELSSLSREMLMYVPETDDIDVVNRLLGVLTPVNRKVAILFFKHFLPWEIEETKSGDFSRFGKRVKKDKQILRKMTAIHEFLSEEFNDIWTWAEMSVVTEYKPKDFMGSIAKAVEKALAGEKKDNGETPPISHEQVIMAVMQGGVTLDDLLTIVDKATNEQAKAA